MNTRTIAVLAAPLLLLFSCRAGGNQEDSENKLQYSPQVNEVETITLERRDFSVQLLSNGRLQAAQKASLSFGQGGVISRVAVSNGARVSRGEVIAELDNRNQLSALESSANDLEKATLDLHDALVGLGYSPDDLSAVPEDVLRMARLRSGYSTAALNHERARRDLEGTVIRAPFSGKVADIKLKKWDNSTSEPFCSVINDSEYDVNFSILESEYPYIEKGLPVKVTLFGDTEPCATGRVVTVNPSIDKNGQVSISARIPGGGRMIDGMNVKVTVDRVIGKQLVVPKSAVVIRDGQEVLFRYNNGKSDWVYVHILNANSESYAVEANASRGARLSEGDLVIVSGNLNLADGSNVVLKQ